MSNFQAQKQLVRDYYTALDQASLEEITEVLSRYTSASYTWRAFHPFEVQTDVADISRLFWQPFRAAVKRMQRRMDVFFAGSNFIGNDGSVWVCSMGHLMGLFDEKWLGIEPTRKMVMLRYAEFHKVEAGKITETAFYFDIPHLMHQAGYTPFPNQTATHMIQPGPAPHDALLFDVSDPKESLKTLEVMNAMIRDLGIWKGGLPLTEELARTWHDDMLWWGPEGVGATYTIDRYAEQHSGPFRAAFTDREPTKHIARIAEGHYSGFFGYPNFRARPSNGFAGFPPSDVLCDFRVIDIYRREGDKLKENWIFIDMLHFVKQQGFDILGELTSNSA